MVQSMLADKANKALQIGIVRVSYMTEGSIDQESYSMFDYFTS